jgi:sortase A
MHGLAVISGHRDKHFRRLSRLRVGDKVELEEADGRLRRYVIADTDIVTRARVDRRLLDRTSDGWVALLTCYPFRYIGPAPQRFIAWARPTTE